MAAPVGALRVTLGANTANFEAGMRRASAQARATGQSISTSMATAQRSTVTAVAGMRTAMAGLGVAFGATAILEAGRNILQFADDLDAAAQQAGMSVERYQTLREALRTLEVPAQQVDRIFRQLQTTLGDVQNGADNAATAALERLGIQSRILNGQITTSDQLLDALAESAQNAGTSAQFTSEIVDIFGQRAGPQLAAALRDGGVALHDLEQAMRDTGTVIDEAIIQQFAEANETIDRFWETTKRGATIWAAHMIKSFASARDGLFDFLQGLPGDGVIAQMALLPLAFGHQRLSGQDARLSQSRSLRGLIAANQPGGTRRPARTGGGATRGGGGGDSAERQREDALRDEHDFQTQMRRFRSETLRAQQDQLTDAVARSQLGDQLLVIEREQYVADQALAVATGELTQARADQKVAMFDQVAIEQQQAVELNRRRMVEAEGRELADHRFEIQAEALRQEAQMAETAADRRDAELRLLELVYRHERAKLAELAIAEGMPEIERAKAQASLDDLDRRQAADTEAVIQGTRGPLEEWLAGANQVNEALENIAANGLQSVSDGLADAIMQTRSWGDVFKSVLSEVAAGLIHIGIQRAIVAAIGGATGQGQPGFLGGIFGGGKASGGPVIPGRTYVVGEKGPRTSQHGEQPGLRHPERRQWTADQLRPSRCGDDG